MSWERILVRPLAVAGAMAFLCMGCGDGGGSSGPKIPNVAGQQAARALDSLRQGGYEHFALVARESAKPVGFVLATNPSAGSVTGQGVQVRVVVSAGPNSRGARNVQVPGIGQCSFVPRPTHGTPCFGGVVTIPVEP